MRRRAARQALISRRRERKRREVRVFEELETIKHQLFQMGSSDISTDYVARLKMKERTLGYVLKSGYTSVTEVEDSLLTRTGLFSPRLAGRGSAGFRRRITAEVVVALIEFRERRLAAIKDTLARN